jgi:hypothetical protein
MTKDTKPTLHLLNNQLGPTAIVNCQDCYRAEEGSPDRERPRSSLRGKLTQLAVDEAFWVDQNFSKAALSVCENCDCSSPAFYNMIAQELRS